MLRSIVLCALLASSAVVGTTQLPQWNTVPYRFRQLDVQATATVAINTAVNDPEWRPPYGDDESALFRLCNAANRSARSFAFGDDWVRTIDYRALWSLTDAMRDWLDRPGMPTAIYAMAESQAVAGIRKSAVRDEIVTELKDVVAFLEGNVPSDRAKIFEEWYQSEKITGMGSGHRNDERKKVLRTSMPPDVSDTTLEVWCYVRRLQERADPATVAEWTRISRDILNKVTGPAAR